MLVFNTFVKKTLLLSHSRHRNNTTDKMENNKVIASDPAPVSDTIEDNGTPLEESDACEVESNQRTTKRKLDDDEDEKDVKKLYSQLLDDESLNKLYDTYVRKPRKEHAAYVEREFQKLMRDNKDYMKMKEVDNKRIASDSETGRTALEESDTSEEESEANARKFDKMVQDEENYMRGNLDKILFEKTDNESNDSYSSQSFETDDACIQLAKPVPNNESHIAPPDTNSPTLKFQTMWAYYDEKLQNLPQEDVDDIDHQISTLIFDRLKAHRKRQC